MRKLQGLLLVALMLLGSVVSADESQKKYSFRVAYGYASEKDLGDILLTADFSKHPLDLSVVAIDAGYLLKSKLFDLPIDLYAKGGLSKFNEVSNFKVGTREYTGFSDTYEVLAYIKLLYNLDFAGNRVRFGFGEGVSYVNDLLVAEVYDATDPTTGAQDPTSRFLNYLDITVDFDIGRLVGVKSMEDVYVGYLLKHRSGVFGLYNGVHGGSNYNSLYLEMNF
jgi:outer membrane protein